MILGHNQFLPDNIESIIYSFHMPIFFFISGLFFKRSNFQQLIKKSSYRLLLPYFLINLICLGIWVTSEYFNDTWSFERIVSRIGAILLGLGYERFGLCPVCAPTWFLWALFWCRCMMNLYSKYCRHKVLKVTVTGLVIVMVIIMRKTNIIIPYAISSALMALPIMIFAFEFKNHILYERTKINNVVTIIISILIAAVSYIINNKTGRCDIDAIWYGKSLLLFYIDAIASCLFLLIIFKDITYENKLILNISNGTIAIVGFHLIIAYYVCKISLFSNCPMILAAAITSLIVLFLCYPIIIACRNYFPAIIGKRRIYYDGK